MYWSREALMWNAASKEGLTPLLCVYTSLRGPWTINSNSASLMCTRGSHRLCWRVHEAMLRFVDLLLKKAPGEYCGYKCSTALIYLIVWWYWKSASTDEKGATVNAVNKEQETLLSVSKRGGIEFYRDVMMLCLESYIKEMWTSYQESHHGGSRER